MRTIVAVVFGLLASLGLHYSGWARRLATGLHVSPFPMHVSRMRWLLLLLALSIPLHGRAFVYSAKEIQGWVVDAGTHQPLEGVNVAAHWVLSFGIEGGLHTDLKLMETVTDKNGRFYFPAWGPEPIPTGLPWEARLKSQDPEIVFFKSGYKWIAVSNEITGPYPDDGAPVRSSQWNGKTIAMKEYDGSLEQYASYTNGVLTGVSYGGCNWKKIPRMIAALMKEKARLKQVGIYSALPTIPDIEGSSVGDDCGSVREFFKEYLK